MKLANGPLSFIELHCVQLVATEAAILSSSYTMLYNSNKAHA